MTGRSSSDGRCFVFIASANVVVVGTLIVGTVTN